MLDQLPANQAAVLRLHILEGLSIRQAAEAMGVSHTTAHRLERKALASLRAELA
ncbi:sigma factor-like helix-turn-helix DNA-binding protein [Synechococcus sp. SynAce01]|uniref:RNA polymerase sigma factor n=2 Tax=Synechococcus TaxID=1129 RepID=UPI0009FA0366|nr:sigma factor-like helix-turn-helix DNA-binding protein [Synechococcus sp. SynAce01]